jgi:hypothetical protein
MGIDSMTTTDMRPPANAAKRSAHRLRPLWSAYGLIVVLAALAGGCNETIKHDENLAGRHAIEFAQAVLVNKNFAKGYELLADGGKRHIPAEKFIESMKRLHPRGFPTRVTAKEYEPMPGENAMWIYLVGQNSEDQFQYRVTMEATGNGDYKVLNIDNGQVGKFFHAGSGKQSFANPISTQP